MKQGQHLSAAMKKGRFRMKPAFVRSQHLGIVRPLKLKPVV